ncbi:MAG: hypothetical protein JNM93_02770 [Bacteriovoracaceae bacterium]|nr:hypothetical protein [Bacteriovoracaceae bacterium]
MKFLVISTLSIFIGFSQAKAASQPFVELLNSIAGYSDYLDKEDVMSHLMAAYYEQVEVSQGYFNSERAIGVRLLLPKIHRIEEAFHFPLEQQEAMSIYFLAVIAGNEGYIGLFRNETHHDRKTIKKHHHEFTAFLSAEVEKILNVKIDCSAIQYQINSMGLIFTQGPSQKMFNLYERLKFIDKAFNYPTTSFDVAYYQNQERLQLSSLGIQQYLNYYYPILKTYVSRETIAPSLEDTIPLFQKLTVYGRTERSSELNKIMQKDLLSLSPTQKATILTLIMNYADKTMQDITKKLLVDAIDLNSKLDRFNKEKMVLEMFKDPDMSPSMAESLLNPKTKFQSSLWKDFFAYFRVIIPALERNIKSLEWQNKNKPLPLVKPAFDASPMDHFFYLIKKNSSIYHIDLEHKIMGLYNNFIGEFNRNNNKGLVTLPILGSFDDLSLLSKIEQNYAIIYLTVLMARDPEGYDSYLNLKIHYHSLLTELETFYKDHYQVSISLKNYYLAQISNRPSSPAFKFLDALSVREGIRRIEDEIIANVTYQQILTRETTLYKKLGMTNYLKLFSAKNISYLDFLSRLGASAPHYRAYQFFKYSPEVALEFIDGLSSLNAKEKLNFFHQIYHDGNADFKEAMVDYFVWSMNKEETRVDKRRKELARTILSELENYESIIDTAFATGEIKEYLAKKSYVPWLKELSRYESYYNCNNHLKK